MLLVVILMEIVASAMKKNEKNLTDVRFVVVVFVRVQLQVRNDHF